MYMHLTRKFQKYIKQVLRKRSRHKNMYNYSLRFQHSSLEFDRTRREKINKNMKELKNTINQT